MFNFSRAKKPAGTAVETVTAVVKIEGMHCVSCGMNIDLSLEEVEGVVEATTDYAKSESVIIFEPNKTSLTKIKKQISKLGYQSV